MRIVEFIFFHKKKDGISAAFLTTAESALGWEVMLNKRGTTYRQLDDADKTNLDKEKALSLLETHPAMVKRPILLHNGTFHIGFKPAQYEDIF